MDTPAIQINLNKNILNCTNYLIQINQWNVHKRNILNCSATFSTALSDKDAL